MISKSMVFCTAIVLVMKSHSISSAAELHGDVWRDDIGFLNTALRVGSESFHSTLFAGAKARGYSRFTAGMGFCKRVSVTPAAFSEVEATAQVFNKNKSWWKGRNILGRVRLNGGWRLNNKIAIYGGPTLNFYQFQGKSSIKKSTFREWNFNDAVLKFWPGFTAGLRF